MGRLEVKLEEIREGMRVRNSIQPTVTGFVRSVGGGELERKLRLESLECRACRDIPGNMWMDMSPPIPVETCARHQGAGVESFVMVEWDARKGLTVATNPAILEPEINLRVF